jgi:hypothetical protein
VSNRQQQIVRNLGAWLASGTANRAGEAVRTNEQVFTLGPSQPTYFLAAVRHTASEPSLILIPRETSMRIRPVSDTGLAPMTQPFTQKEGRTS